MACPPPSSPSCSAQLLQGISRACFWTGSQTHVVRGSGRAAGALATMNFVAGLGLLAGPVVAGVLSEVTPVARARRRRRGRRCSAWCPPSCWTGSRPSPRPPTGRRGGSGAVRASTSGAGPAVTAGGWRGLLSSYVPVALDAARQSASTIGAPRGRWRTAPPSSGPPSPPGCRARWSTRVVLGGHRRHRGGHGADRGRSRGTPGSPPSSCCSAGSRRGPSRCSARPPPPSPCTRRSAATRSRSPAPSGRPRCSPPRSPSPGLVVVLPLAPAVALVGAAMTVPALGLRHRTRHPEALMRPSLRSTSTRTFAAIPAVVLAEQALSRRPLHPRWLPAAGLGVPAVQAGRVLPDRPGRRSARHVPGPAGAAGDDAGSTRTPATPCTWATWCS